MLFITIINSNVIQIYVTRDAGEILKQFVLQIIQKYDLTPYEKGRFLYRGFENNVWNAVVELSQKADEIR